jgi:predicted metallo-beta-lactamase superfamily hydrolase
MDIKILGTESLGVRGLCCSVELKNRRIVIDPGIALGWLRHGLSPHPFQIAVGACIREEIIEELKGATDVVISHFHGDHCPLYDPNPYQLGIDAVKGMLSKCRIWAKGADDGRFNQQRRREQLAIAIEKDLQSAEGAKERSLEFSFPVPHGKEGRKENTVMMSRVEEEGEVFVHASDIQLLDEQAIQQILDWSPDTVLVSGPPLYRYTSTSEMQREKAWKNAMELSKRVDALIVDHHLLRSEEGITWLNELSDITEKRVSSAAGFMRREPVFLEAWRKELYEWLPVSENWHQDYQQGNVGLDHYKIKGWETLVEKGKISPCKWYYCCPIKRFTEQGKLESYWIENYCLVGNKDCTRYQMEEKGEYHPDNMLPNGEIRENLK